MKSILSIPSVLIAVNLSSCNNVYGNTILNTPSVRKVHQPHRDAAGLMSSSSSSSSSTRSSNSDEKSHKSPILGGTSRTAMLDEFKKKHPNEPTFLQAVEEMALSLSSLFHHPTKGKYYQNAFRLMLEPERIITFRVPWVDDNGILQINTGYRVEFSSVLGPYKGGLRFHPSVNIDVLKSLAFEQMFKNALTGLPLGGGKGGSDFDPKGKSENEILRFCQSFMTELYRYLGDSTDVPAGDIGVSGKEIGYMYGQYKRLSNKHGEGVLTGKPLSVGGSHFRPEATGYGLVYMAKLAIEDKLQSTLQNAKCAVSGSGNVAQYAADMLMQQGAKVITMSDSNGTLVFPKGMTRNDWDNIVQAKQVERLRLSQISNKVSGYYIPNTSPWTLPISNDTCYDYAFPCATQNEIDATTVETMIEKRNVCGIFEGANIPVSLDGQACIRSKQCRSNDSDDVIRNKKQIIYIPGKAANAGGVGVSGFEMSQNMQKLIWDMNDVDEKLQDLMKSIYCQLVDVAGEDGTLETGANQAGFIKVAQGMKDLGWLG